MRKTTFMLATSVLLSVPTLAQETTTYTYDAKGRVVKVVRSGSVNNGVTTEYTHDKAGNRTRVKVVGAP
jgi:YD repeat-containing protein